MRSLLPDRHLPSRILGVLPLGSTMSAFDITPGSDDPHRSDLSDADAPISRSGPIPCVLTLHRPASPCKEFLYE